MAEDPGCVVLELEIVLGRGHKLVTGTAMVSLTLSTRMSTYMSKVDFCLAKKSASVSGRSSFALVRETETRMPVSML